MGEKRKAKVRPVPHLSLQSNERTILDEVDALLLRRISETNSLTEAAKMLRISYRNAWDRVRKVESRTGKRVLKTRIGGADGGSSMLTPEGLSLFREYRSARKYLFNALDDRESAGNVRYKLTARNMVRASITKIERGDIISLIRMASLGPVKLTSIISNEAVDDLELNEGDKVEAVIKSTEVMLAKPLAPPHAKKTKSTG